MILNFISVICYICIIVQTTSRVSAAPTEKDELNSKMLQMHNEVRQKALMCKIPGQPQASTMPNLKYDQELADLAQKWADNCTFGHDDKTQRQTSLYKQVGQNFAGHSSFEGAFQLWFDEYKDYDYENLKCAEGKACGHYTQVKSLMKKETNHFVRPKKQRQRKQQQQKQQQQQRQQQHRRRQPQQLVLLLK
ncbi:unnamed protein product [Echinostoma caproni]|uniref:SCP domain-containing protein n=1 Tax=Echinostoma caproni TaxID=27848 RepID=A0A183B069_9TREM|nr:unnamed protein product [Echinostoma caproni]